MNITISNSSAAVPGVFTQEDQRKLDELLARRDAWNLERAKPLRRLLDNLNTDSVGIESTHDLAEAIAAQALTFISVLQYAAYGTEAIPPATVEPHYVVFSVRNGIHGRPATAEKIEDMGLSNEVQKLKESKDPVLEISASAWLIRVGMQP